MAPQSVGVLEPMLSSTSQAALCCWHTDQTDHLICALSSVNNLKRHEWHACIANVVIFYPYTKLKLCVKLIGGFPQCGVTLKSTCFIDYFPYGGMIEKRNYITWWRHQMETFSVLLAICEFAAEFAAQRPVTRSFDVFFDLRLNKPSSKQWWGWWFETLSRPLWSHCN